MMTDPFGRIKTLFTSEPKERKSNKSVSKKNYIRPEGDRADKERRPGSSTSTHDDELGQGACDRNLHYKILEQFVEETSKKGIEGLVKEYRKLDSIHDPTDTCDAFKSNMLKNRYSDVVCLDKTRVRLRFAAGLLGDYIHANLVESKLLENKFICTQGPLFSTIDDFWRMIYQERIATILMLCKPVEDGRPKCNVYWPENKGDSQEISTVLKVTNMGENSDETGKTIQLQVELHQDYVVTESDGLSTRDPLIVNLRQWTNWPDRGVPDEQCHTIPCKLLDLVRHAPCVVHCSAGIGRTGSIMALEFALRKLHKGKEINFEEITKELRKSRAQCVQTEVQYLYIHRVMVAHALVEAGQLSDKAKKAGEKFLIEYDNKMKK